jgi:hypothetical protein
MSFFLPLLCFACTDIGDDTAAPGASASNDGSTPVDASLSDTSTPSPEAASDDGALATSPDSAATSDDGGADGTTSAGEDASIGVGQDSSPSTGDDGGGEDATTGAVDTGESLPEPAPETGPGGGTPDAPPDVGPDAPATADAAADSSPELDAGADSAADASGPDGSDAAPDGASDAATDGGGLDTGTDAIADVTADVADTGGSGGGSLQLACNANLVANAGTLNIPSSHTTCSSTEVALWQKDPRQDPMSCLNCLFGAGCLDDSAGDTGQECEDPYTGAGAGGTPAECLATLNCVVGDQADGTAQKASATPAIAYCGAGVTPTTCTGSASSPMGVCKGQIAAGFPAGFTPSTIFTNLGIGVYASGRANAIVACSSNNLCTTCTQ